MGQTKTQRKKSKTRQSSLTAKASAAPLREFPRALPMMLMRGREAVMRYFRPSLRQHGLTEQQWRVLRALMHYGPMEVTELADVTILLAPSLSRILRDLTARELVIRTTTKSDLRRSVIRISPAGVRLMQTAAPHSESGYRAITERFGERRLKQLQKMLLELESCLLDEPDGSQSRTRAR
jgi:homoprotocatechuate degradation regulator HpaR